MRQHFAQRPIFVIAVRTWRDEGREGDAGTTHLSPICWRHYGTTCRYTRRIRNTRQTMCTSHIYTALLLFLVPPSSAYVHIN
ncbi:hypothetical protein ACLKA6_013070 [Drosophila palustris]